MEWVGGATRYLEEEQQAVEIVDRAADRGAGHTPPVHPSEPQRHLGRLGEGGLDHLGLVQADPPPLDTG